MPPEVSLGTPTAKSPAARPDFATLHCEAKFCDATDWSFHANALTPCDVSGRAFPNPVPASEEFA
jgi:hypothetical protein